MRIRDVVRRAGRSLGQAKARTLLTSLAIAVGAFTVTLALAAGAGGRTYTDNLVKNNGDARNLSISPPIPMQGDADKPKEYGVKNTTAGMTQPLTQSDIDKIKAIAGVDSITPSYGVAATYITREGQKKYETNLSVKADRTELPLAAGSLKDNTVPEGSVVIPDTLAGALGFNSPSDAIGKQITLRVDDVAPGQPLSGNGKDINFTVAAVSKKASTVLRNTDAVQLSVTDGKAIYDYQMGASTRAGQYYGLNVRLKDGADVKQVQKSIENAGYRVFSLQDVQEALFQFINIVQWGAAGFGALAILASIFGIINTQYISVLERTQQIGLMKALGARRRDVGRLFRYEAAWVGFLGGVIGTGLALLVGFLNPMIASSLNLEKGTALLQFNPISSIVLVVSLMVIAVLAGYFPARKAAKLDPIEALRTE